MVTGRVPMPTSSHNLLKMFLIRDALVCLRYRVMNNGESGVSFSPSSPRFRRIADILGAFPATKSDVRFSLFTDFFLNFDRMAWKALIPDIVSKVSQLERGRRASPQTRRGQKRDYGPLTQIREVQDADDLLLRDQISFN